MSEQKTAAEIIRDYSGPHVRIMEVCGTHTHEIFRLGIRSLLPPQAELISGPGCPVCVTPVGFIDEAIWLAEEKGATITTFGDLVRVPGTNKSLAVARSEGARVQVVYSPVDAVAYAEEHPDEQVVFLSVGFETTTPASCLAVSMAQKKGLGNFSLLTANKTMPNAYAALKGSADVFLYPGHVHAITGTALLEDLQKQGALKGYPDGLFKGDRAMTRYEFAAMLDRIVRNGVTLDPQIAKEFEPELGRIYVERISGQDNDRKKIERVRVNNSDSKYPEGKTRDVYGSKIQPVVSEKAAGE